MPSNSIINEITDVNAIFQAVTLECSNELNEDLVNDLIECILNETPSITTLFYHTIMQEMQILTVYSKFVNMDIKELLQRILQDYENDYSGYSMQIFFFREVLNIASDIVEDKEKTRYENNSEKFNNSAEVFFSTFNDFTQAFRFIPNFNNYFSQKILPETITVSKFLEQVFLGQQLYLTSGSID